MSAVLAPGARVRHQYDGARGVVESFDSEVRMYVVAFPDGPDLVLPDDVRRIGRSAKKARRP
jgi:hypothetical protein